MGTTPAGLGSGSEMLTGEDRQRWVAALATEEPQAAPPLTEAERARWQAALSPVTTPALSDAVRQMWVDALAEIDSDLLVVDTKRNQNTTGEKRDEDRV